MTNTSANQQRARDDENWAELGPRLAVDEASRGPSARMVNGRMVTGPIQGFGKMWQKTYRVPLEGADVTPGEVIATWKRRFPEFWPEGNRFYAPLTGIAPGEVALLDISLGPGAGLSTGVLVLYADAESFTLMTPEGHVFAGWITFSAASESGVTVAHAEVLMRAADPICELGLAFGGHRREDQFWHQTLTSLATSFGVASPQVEQRVVCVDPRRQWRRAGNIWRNGAVRTGLFRATAPVRWLGGLPRRFVGR
jgi:hypothetical protein